MRASGRAVAKLTRSSTASHTHTLIHPVRHCLTHSHREKETYTPRACHAQAFALRMLVDAVLRQQLLLTQRAFQMTVQIILEEDLAILYCTAQWMGLLAPELVNPCIAAPAA